MSSETFCTSDEDEDSPRIQIWRVRWLSLILSFGSNVILKSASPSSQWLTA